MKKTLKIAITLVSVICIGALILSSCSQKDKKTNAAPNAITGSISVITREDGSGTRDAFNELIGIIDENDTDLTVKSAEETNSTSVMMTTVSGNKKAIGYVSLGSVSDIVKTVSLNGVAPSAEAVKDATYSLQRPFNIAYIESDISDIAKDFISFIMSNAGQKIIEEEGYISIGGNGIYKPSDMNGTVTLAGSTSVSPVMNVLADKYKELNPNVKIEIQESGSSAGIKSAAEKAVDIAMASRELKNDELQILEGKQIALDGIAVVVNKENPINNLSSSQIKSIYTGEITSWEDVK